MTCNRYSTCSPMCKAATLAASPIRSTRFSIKRKRICRAEHFSAGFTRLRPVLMTALAMVIGMLPFSFGLGEGGEQNAPLGRAVIGGLIFATFATLFFVPVVYSMLRKEEFVCDEDEQFEREERRTSTDEKQPEDE